MIRISLVCLFSLFAATSSAARAAENQPPEGFTALFNGKDLSGWKGLVADPPRRARMATDELARAQGEADQKMRAHWKVEEGVLVFDGKGDSLCTARDFQDFELLVDWKILPQGDSGIYLRGSPQVQIWDRPEGSGGLYNNQRYPSRPLRSADRPVGEWNTFRIRMVGERVWVWLNGALVVNDTVMENLWEREKPIDRAGQIELQNHGNTLYFKNIFIRELPRPDGAAYPLRPLEKKGARVAVVGDSITEQKLYSRFIEDYLVACERLRELRVMQFGWGGERAPGFAERLENDLLPYRPDVVTTCYGMNDGGYRPYEQSIGDAYRRSMNEVVRRVKGTGAVVVVGSPGAVDTFSFRRAGLAPADYNLNLSRLRDIARELALEEGMLFANVHDSMVDAMQAAKPVLGESYDVCGSDGFHPQANGHLVMAYAFLKGLGVDGLIGLFTLDLKSGKASASQGHEVLSSSEGRLEIESRRYPFCFFGEEKSPSGTRSILPFVPFNRELNRFLLVVRNLPSSHARVTWGEAAKTFRREDLEAGINLAEEFLENPFSASFRKLDEAVGRKQAFETAAIKEVITRFRTARQILGDDAEGKAMLDALRDRLLKKQEALQAEVVQLAVPVRHTISITPQSTAGD